jgi:hypothetical protein
LAYACQNAGLAKCLSAYWRAKRGRGAPSGYLVELG